MPLTHKPCTHKWRNNQQPLPTLADVALLVQHRVLWPNSTQGNRLVGSRLVDAASGLRPNSTQPKRWTCAIGDQWPPVKNRNEVLALAHRVCIFTLFFSYSQDVLGYTALLLQFYFNYEVFVIYCYIHQKINRLTLFKTQLLALFTKSSQICAVS